MNGKKLKLIVFIFLSCLLSGCFQEKDLSFKIADAENQFFTKSGRLFVTGGKNIYEIKKDSSQKLVRSKPLFEGNCYATGIVEYGRFLYATCTSIKKPRLRDIIKQKRCRIRDGKLLKCLKKKFSRSYLLTAELNERPQFEIISKLDSILFPNGLTIDKFGNLYSADSFSQTIFKMELSSFNPYKVGSIKAWYKGRLLYPNGLKVQNNSLYITDLNKLKKITFTKEGKPGTLKILYQSRHFLDDFSFYKKNILLTKFSKGIITLVKENGKIFNSPKFKMHPSSILQGQHPLFKRNQFVITDKGRLYDFKSNIGNRLKVITIDKIFMEKI